MALATLSIDLVAKFAELQAGLDKAGQLAEKTVAGIEARFAKLQGVAAGVGGALASAIAGAGLGERFRLLVDGLDKLNDLADATGSTVENLSALEDIAGRTGTTMDTVGDAVVKLNKALGEAKADSPMAAAFAKLGLNAAELRKLDPAEALRRVSVAFSGFADDGDKARYIAEIFGKSIREVAPLLNDLAKATSLTATVTTAQAAEAEKFNQQLAFLATNSQNAARSLVSDLLPSLNRMLLVYTQLKTGPGILASIGEVFKGKVFATAEEGLASYTADIKELDERIERLKNDKRPLVAANSGPLLVQLESARANLERFAAAYRNVVAVAPTGRPANETGGGYRGPEKKGLGDLPTGKTPAPKAAKEKPFVSAILDDSTVKALRAIEATDPAKIRELEETLRRLYELVGDSNGDAATTAAIADITRQLAEMSPAARQAAEEQKKLSELLAATPTGQLELLQQEANLLAEAMQKATNSYDLNKLAEALGIAYDKMAEVRGKAAEVTDEFAEFAKQAARNIQDALGDQLFSLLDGKFDNIGKSFSNLLKRMVAEAAAAQLGKSLFGNDYAKTGQIGGLAGAGIEWLKGLNFGGARAEGGPIVPGRAYLVGERGPELVMPQQSGTVIPNGKAMGNSVTFAPVMQFSGHSTAEMRAIARQEAMELFQRFERNRR